MKKYWHSFTEIDRSILLDQVSISIDLAKLNFEDLPWQIRQMLYVYYNKVWRNKRYELQP